MKKFTFQNPSDNGKLLSIHHTTRASDGTRNRIPFVRCAFSDNGNLFVAIDHRGSIHVFNLAQQYFTVLSELVNKCSCIRFHPANKNQLILGLKTGHLCLLEYDYRSGAARVKLNSQAYPSGHPIINLAFPTASSVTTFLSATSTGQVLVHDIVTFSELGIAGANARNDSRVKHVQYMPTFEHVLASICQDDTLRIWGCVQRDEPSYERRIRVLKLRDKYLLTNKLQKLVINIQAHESNENIIRSIKKDFGKAGNLTALCFSPDSSRVVLATLDSTLVIMGTNDGTFEVTKVIKLSNEIHIEQMEFIATDQSAMVMCRTNVKDLLLIDLEPKKEQLVSQFMISQGDCYRFYVSPMNSLFANMLESGEVELMSLATIFRKVEAAVEERAYLAKDGHKKLGAGTLQPSMAIKSTREIEKMLSQERVIPLLLAFDEYPPKYRETAWTLLLKLPMNDDTFCDLLRKGQHPCVEGYSQQFPLKNRNALRKLKTVVSALAHWCPAYGLCDFVPYFVFPFLNTINSKHLIVAFEICASLLINHGRLWTEFAPLEPINYLGMIENLIAHSNPRLMQFFKRHSITSVTFAWSLVHTAFSEVLDNYQWQKFWDHVVSSEPWHLIFATVAYNVVQAPIIMRLSGQGMIELFFHDQNLIDMKQFLMLTHELSLACPESLHPRQYFPRYEPLLSPIYQKFYNYPRQFVEKQNEIYRKSKEARRHRGAEFAAKMDSLMAQEEALEHKLEEKLRDWEHAKRLKRVERIFAESSMLQDVEGNEEDQMMALEEQMVENRKLRLALDDRFADVKERLYGREAQLEAKILEQEVIRYRQPMELQLRERLKKLEETAARRREQLAQLK